MTSTIHRFTPPTCTLEIIGKKSALSRWTNSDVLQKFQFKLRFDDPRQPTSRQVTIEGDQQDLAQLQIAVNHYLQTQLQNSLRSPNAEIIPPGSVANQQTPYLKSQGLVSHELFFGSLNHDSDLPKIKLGTVQLFDLVTALEAYQTEISTLPDLKTTHSQPKIIPLWGKIAAVAIAVVSITTILKPQMQLDVASNSAQPESSREVPEIDQITPPSVGNINQQPTPIPQLKEPLASTKRLPPPPAVETPKPKPDIPDPADYALSDVARQSGLDDSIKPETTNNQSTKGESINQSETQPKITPETQILADTPPKERPIKEETIVSLESKVAPQNRTQIETELNSEFDILDKFDESIAKPDQDLATNSINQLSLTQQVIAYFDQQWQPPADLKQSLEYRLWLDPDGSIIRVVPLGKAARLYLSQTNIPVNGQPFITPQSPIQPSRIRLLLNPDGRVQAFTE